MSDAGRGPERDEPAHTVSVVVVTYNRPELLRDCLTQLLAQRTAVHELIVVDSSPDRRSEAVVDAFGQAVRYLRNEYGVGTTATSRNLGLARCTGDVVAFVDDDAMAHPDWSEQLLAPFADPLVVGVGGRAVNGEPGERDAGVDEIGLFLPDKRLTGNFAADPGRTVEVDHVLGASMAFRRQTLLDQGGIHDLYPGPCLREETDICFRAGRAGRLVYTPFAVVDHLAGPYAKGRRFDLRYQYYSERNHMVLLRATVSRRSAARYVHTWAGDLAARLRAATAQGARAPRALAGALVRGAYGFAGLVVGATVPPRRGRPRT